MKRLIFFFFLFNGNYLFSQVETDSLINYSPTRILSWKDFKGEIQENQPFHASTNWRVEYSFKYNGNKFQFTLVTQFRKYFSWDISAYETDELLKHEQLHFDIGELFARKMRKEMLELKPTVKTVSRDVKQIYARNLMNCKKMERLYDKETNHSMNAKKQKEWEKRIKKELKSLQKFTNIENIIE